MNATSGKAKAIFVAALKLAPDQWDAHLAGACGADDELRSRVRDLLQANAAAGSFLESPATGLFGTVAEPIREGPGTVIGPYKLLAQLGEGGMGLVFLAEQQQPVRRKVALKILKPGMDTRQVIARFEAERQALALMDHPHIAKVHDGGETASGRPYFVMELVKGTPITDYCDRHQVPIRARLELFIHVCQAVQHAHQKGIIHRDIKPSNVLVALHDDAPVVKVIDFGIAKATGAQLTDKTLFTAFAQMVGTPLYMSPEQAGRSNSDVDTRSDIYALGVLLYELLTGTTPFDKERFKEAGYNELQRIICEEEPPRPSKRLGTLGQAATTVSERRQSDPRGLNRLLVGELDWVVMKALEKDRNRRYETASALAADVQHYLHDEPVLACPPSSWYRLSKYGRRHRWGLALTAVAAAALVVLVAGSLIWTVFLNEAFHEAEGNFRRAEGAEKTAMERLYGSLRAQAHASRFSHCMGQRFKSLEALTEAAKIARSLNTLAAHELDLRNEAIACLALADLRVAKEWDGWPSGSMTLDFDGALERYARADRQGVVHIHRALDGSEICRLSGFGPGNYGGGETSPLWSADGRFLLLAHGRPNEGGFAIKVWTLSGQKPAQIPVQPPRCTYYAFSPNSRELVAVQATGTLHLYDLPSGRQLKQLQGVANSRCVVFHPRARQLAISHAKGVQIRDLETGAVLADLPQPMGAHYIAWHPNGKTLAVGGGDQMIHLWDVAARKPLMRLERRPVAGLGFAFNHAGDLLAGSGWDGTLYLWETRTGRQLFSTQATVVAARLRFSTDDQLLAAGIDTENHKLRLWQLPFPLGYRTLGRGMFSTSCATSPKERLLAVGSNKGVALWDLTSGTQAAFLNVGWSLAVFEPSGALLASGLGDGGLRRWPIERDAAEPGLLRIGPPQKLPLPGPKADIATSQDGHVLVCAGYRVANRRGLVWHRDLPGPPLPLPYHEDSRYIDVSPDGQWVATGSHFATKVKISAARTGQLVHELPVDTGSRVRFSPDGRWLATSGGGCRLWAVDSWRQGPHIGGEILAFSPDGKLLAVETGHGAVRLVDPDTGREYARLEDPNQARAEQMCFTPDGTELVITSGDSDSTQVWDLRIIRKQLAEINLDWDLPAYPPARAPEKPQVLRIQVVMNSVPTLSDFNNLIELYPKSTSGWSQRASYYANLKQWDKAIADYSKVIALDPKDVKALLSRGNAYSELRQWDKVLADYSKTIELEPNHVFVRNRRGVVYANLKQWDRAIADYSKAIELDPKNHFARSQRGFSYANLKQWDKAIADYTKAVDLDPRSAAVWTTQRGLAYAGLGQLDRADADYTRASELLDPKDARMHSALAWRLSIRPNPKGRDPGRVVHLAKKAVVLVPKEGNFWKTLGVAYYRAGDWKAALAALEKAMALRSGGDTFDWFIAAMCHEKLGDKQKARGWYDRATRAVAGAPANRYWGALATDEDLRSLRAEAAELLKIDKGR